LSAPTPPAVPGSNFPFDARCQKCGYEALIHSPEHAFKTDSGQTEVIHDYRKDLPKYGIGWDAALAAGKIQHVFRFLCTDCGKETQLTRPFERMEAGCAVAGWFTLVTLIVVIGSAIYLYGAEAAMLIIPALPFFFAIFSELVELPYVINRKKLSQNLKCSACGSAHLLALQDAQGNLGICPGCGEKALKYTARTE
jgi:DNA-directed RNA polymerase subunit RPC12/RpoP